MKASTSVIKALSFYLSVITFLLSCSYKDTDFELGSIFDPTFDFSKSSKLNFDGDFVEVTGGKARLKRLDLEYTGEDFNAGTHRGTEWSAGQLKPLQLTKTSAELDLRQLIPDKADHLVGYYKMDDDNWVDVSGKNNDGTLVAGSTVFSLDSQVGSHSGDFSSVQLNVGNHLPTQTGERFAIMGWFKPELADTLYRRVFDNSTADGSGRQGLTCWVRDYTTFVSFRCQIWKDGVSRNIDFDAVTLNSYHHFVLTSDGTTVRLYVNGTEIGTDPHDSNSGVGDYFVGSTSLGNHFDGKMDEFALLTEYLSPEEVEKIYQYQAIDFTSLSRNWAPKWDHLIGYWKMNGNWQDSSGRGHHAIPVTGTVHSSSTKKVGSGSMALDGSTHRAQIPDNTDLSSPSALSFSVWVRFDNIYLDAGEDPNNTETIFIKGTNPLSGPTNSEYNLYYDPRLSRDQIVFFLSDGVAISLIITSVSTRISSKSWHHIAGMWTNNEQTLYLDGVLMDSKTVAKASLNDLAHDLRIGGGSASRRMAGHIDDMAFWNVPLTAGEFSKIYHRQKQKYAGSYDSEVIEKGAATSTWPEMSWLTTLPYGKELVGDFNSDGSPEGESVQGYSLFSGSLQNGLVGYWPLNELAAGGINGGSHDVEDRSGGNSDGVELNGVSFGTPTIFDRGVKFDEASTQRIDIVPQGPLVLPGDSDVTGSAWVYLDPDYDTSNSRQIFLNISTNLGYLFEFQMMDAGHVNPGQIRIHQYNGSLSRNCGVSLGQQITEPGFYHLVATSDVTGKKAYLNGIEIISCPLPPIDMTGHTVDLIEIGRNTNGIVDEIAIWSRALSPGEIMQLYRRGSNRVKFQVKSCVDSACECKSFNTSPVGSSTDCDGDATLNAVDLDDVHKASFIGPGGDGTTYYSELFNREATNLSFNCALNTSDNDANICVDDEMTLTASPRPSPPLISYSDFPASARPPSNPYLQFRAYVEADENLACAGSPCLPELTTVNLNPGGVDKYHGGLQEIKPTTSIKYREIRSAIINADSCATFQLSPNDVNYYHWDGSTWVAAASSSDRSPREDVEVHIEKFANQFGPGELFIKVFLETNSSQTSPCSVQGIDIRYR